ncbi:MAG: hypothetical protein IPL32_18740 [Chloracidobacterium sp.]|nr:hypothetical protein [Chloracidobacterium sp.]
MSYTTEEITANHGDPVWEAIWSTIKGWDIQRTHGAGYSSPSGDDVQAIFNAIKAVK